MKYYSKESAHGTSSSFGFDNDTVVKVFDSKTARDEYVDNSRNLSCDAIKRNEVTYYAANYCMIQDKTVRPQPFTNEYWAIVACEENDETPGLIGTVEIAGGMYGDYGVIAPFYG